MCGKERSSRPPKQAHLKATHIAGHIAFFLYSTRDAP